MLLGCHHHTPLHSCLCMQGALRPCAEGGSAPGLKKGVSLFPPSQMITSASFSACKPPAQVFMHCRMVGEQSAPAP